MEIVTANSCEKHINMLWDDQSIYFWFFTSPETSTEHAANAIIDWCASYSVPCQLVFNGPTHFKNEKFRLIVKVLGMPHHFALPYFPRSNGRIERFGKELLLVFWAVNSEPGLDHEEGPNLLLLVQSAITNSPSQQRAGVSPVIAMTGMGATPPIRR